MTFLDRIRWQGINIPHAPALSVGGRKRHIVTYGELNRYIANFCARLSARGIVPGSLYGVHIPDDLLYIVTILSLQRLGAATVLVTDVERVGGWPLAGILTSSTWFGGSFPVENVHEHWLTDDASYPWRPSARANPKDLCHVAWTSGSTGRPKGVPLSHRVVQERAAQLGKRFSPEFLLHGTMFCSVGLGSGWGYHVLLYALAGGSFLCLPGPSFDDTARKISSYRIRSMFSSPLYLADFSDLSRKEARDFQSLEVIVSGGGPLRATLADSVRTKICNRLISSYGSVETGFIATGAVELLNLEKNEVGFVIPGVEVDLVDPVNRTPLAEGVGNLRIRSDSAARGYFGPGTEASDAFDGDRFYSADRGSLSAEGLLSLYGRESNVVNLGGPKTTLEAIEALYASVPGVREVASAVTPDHLGVDRLVAFVQPSEQ